MYQVLLLENPQVKIRHYSTLNPATLMPVPGESGPLHSCTETTDLIYASRRDLKDSPLNNSKCRWLQREFCQTGPTSQGMQQLGMAYY